MTILRFLHRSCLIGMSGIAFTQICFAQDSMELAKGNVDIQQTENPARWSHSATVSILPATMLNPSANPDVGLADVILGSDIFTKAKPDLSDLRLFDSIGTSIPFALRYLRTQKVQQTIFGTEFNRDEPDEGAHEITLDLLQNDIGHNAIRVITTDDNFRRPIQIDGSADGTLWRRLAIGNLIRFSDGEKKFEIDRFEYAESRFRFVRVRVTPDTNHSVADASKDDFKIRDVNVLREVDLPGERATFEAQISQRDPVRSNGAPSSAWIIDLGGNNVPCDQIEVDIADKQFARDVTLQAELPYGPLGKLVFSPIFGQYGTTWQRKPGETANPMIASFNEVQTSRLRLVVTDYRNAPLSIRSVKFSAAARQIVFAPPTNSDSNVRVFVGNPDADFPNFDFARNLPDQLVPVPSRGQLRPIEENPIFVPPPKAFLERFPWLIYIVLSAVIATLAIVIASLAKTAIRLHDTSLSPLLSIQKD